MPAEAESNGCQRTISVRVQSDAFVTDFLPHDDYSLASQRA
jgi:hypothetical protein